MVYRYKYFVSWHYTSSCFYLEHVTHRMVDNVLCILCYIIRETKLSRWAQVWRSLSSVMWSRRALKPTARQHDFTSQNMVIFISAPWNLRSRTHIRSRHLALNVNIYYMYVLNEPEYRASYFPLRKEMSPNFGSLNNKYEGAGIAQSV